MAVNSATSDRSRSNRRRWMTAARPLVVRQTVVPEMWSNLKKALSGSHSLPDSDSLQADLTGPGYKYTSDGRLVLESKDEMKKRGMPSPDEGDAVALCFSEPNGSPYVRATGFNRVIEYPDVGYA
ncbi:hypothetical protein ACVIM9_001885 [Bradyrhizobium sp. USDA 4520]